MGAAIDGLGVRSQARALDRVCQSRGGARGAAGAVPIGATRPTLKPAGARNWNRLAALFSVDALRLNAYHRAVRSLWALGGKGPPLAERTVDRDLAAPPESHGPQDQVPALPDAPAA